jgi:hypothetical protein
MSNKKERTINTDFIAEVNKYIICLGVFFSQVYTMLLLNATWCVAYNSNLDMAKFAVDKVKQFGGFSLAILGLAVVLFILNKLFEKKKSLLVVCVTATSIVTIIYSIYLTITVVI